VENEDDKGIDSEEKGLLKLFIFALKISADFHIH
jgi:hypothetical protein